MKILIVASNMVHIKNFHMPYVNALRENGHEVYIMASGDGADFNVPFKKRSLSFKNLFLVSKIKKILKSQRFDAVLLHTTLASFWTRMAIKRLKDRPYVINTVHGYLFNEHTSFLKTKAYLFCEKLVRNVTDNIVVMNSEDMTVAIKHKLSIGEVFEIDGMGVNFSRIQPVDKPENSENELINLVFVGEISKRKNQIFLVRALKKLPDYSLTLVGDGDESNTIRKEARRLGVESRLKITGFTKNVSKYLSEADIYVSASQIEGLPFNVMEAMYARLPIVASDVKGNRDLLNQKNLYTYNDEEEYVDLVRSTPTVRVNYDMEKYTLEKVVPANTKMYLSLINKKRRAD
ncbi:MAG: glycosyltransferase [Clostridia bacterium]|nr:glycosyltransferase [Clostridia bacterium]